MGKNKQHKAEGPLSGIDRPVMILTPEALRRFCRFEITFTELMEGRLNAQIDIPEPYQIIPQDLKAAVENWHRKGISKEDFGNAFCLPLCDYDDLYHGVKVDIALDGPDAESAVNRWIPDRYSVFANAWQIFLEVFYFGQEDTDLDEVIREVDIWEKNQDKPLLEKEYSKRQKWNILRFWNDERLKMADSETKELYRKVMDSLCEENDLTALRMKAYACYGNGNAAYGQNWPASLECLLKLMELSPDPQIANTLGYMYYYGRCSNGVPEYDKAFYYYSIGAAGGSYESRYKLADMFLHGYGVSKNPAVVWSIIWELYGELIKDIQKEEFTSEFADVAFRAGNLWKDGINCYESMDNAFRCYLQAQYAIRMRMLREDYYGDKKIAGGIEQAIAEVLPKTSYLKPVGTVHLNSLYLLLRYGFGQGRHMEMKVKRISETEAKLTFRIVPFENEPCRPRIFITVPQMHYCGFAGQVSVTARKISFFQTDGDKDCVPFDSVQGGELYFYGKKVAEIHADFVYRKPKI